MYNSAVLMWIVSHLPSIIGASGIIIAVYKFLRFLFRSTTIATMVYNRVLNAEETLKIMSVNHLPHIEQAANKSNDLLVDIREELRMARIAREVRVSES